MQEVCMQQLTAQAVFNPPATIGNAPSGSERKTDYLY
jgi:hypothetical protein